MSNKQLEYIEAAEFGFWIKVDQRSSESGAYSPEVIKGKILKEAPLSFEDPEIKGRWYVCVETDSVSSLKDFLAVRNMDELISPYTFLFFDFDDDGFYVAQYSHNQSEIDAAKNILIWAAEQWPLIIQDDYNYGYWLPDFSYFPRMIPKEEANDQN